LKVIKVNVEITPEISKRFGVRGLPTLVLLDGSEEIGRVAGCTNSSLFTFLNKHLSVELAPDQPDAPVVKKPAHKGPFSAFHHDLQLKETMLQRAALGAQQARITGLI
ncbi:thioredoxin family protein, partial [Pseudomonas viridiflava]